MKVEQRIGRLDRIGHTHRVLVYNFSIENTVEDRVLELGGVTVARHVEVEVPRYAPRDGDSSR